MGVKLNLKEFLAALAAVYQPGLEHRLMQMLSEFSNPLSQPSKSKVVRRRWIVADDIRVNLEVLRMLIRFPAESVLQAFHNVFQRIFRFVFRRPDSFVHSRKEFGAFFNILSVKPGP